MKGYIDSIEACRPLTTNSKKNTHLMSFFVNNNGEDEDNRRVRVVIWGQQAIEHQNKIHIMQVLLFIYNFFFSYHFVLYSRSLNILCFAEGHNSSGQMLH